MFFLRKGNTMGSATLFYRQMAAMISAGVPVKDALITLGEKNESSDVENLIATINRDINVGETPGKSLTQYPEFFKKMLQYFVSSEDQNSEFSKVLYAIADDNEKMEDMKKKIKAILFYPVSIILLAIIILAIILIFVIPTFIDMFASFGSSLPVPTQMVIALSNIFNQYWHICFACIALVYFFLKKNKRILDSIINIIPGYGGIIKNLSIIRFLRFLSMMLTLKVPVDEAIEYSAGAVNNIVYAGKLKDLKNSVSEKSQISSGLEKTRIFSPMILRMINAGEKAGSIELTLGEIANYYEKKLDSTEKFIQILEIFMMIFIGTFIGGIVIAMYLPIFQMAGAVV